MTGDPRTAESLPEFLTWEEYLGLPTEIAQCIDGLDRGKVIWARTGPRRNQRAAVRLRNALESAWSAARSGHDGCFEADSEQPIFFTAKNDFLKPDFVLYQCLSADEQDVPASAVVIVGEVLSPSNSVQDMQRKTTRFAEAGIPWYWEVEATETGLVIQINALLPAPEHRPAGVQPLREFHYEPVARWTGTGDFTYHLPFPFTIPARELEY
ncbi:Uma2 family endonuclease [Nocardia rhizosphaerae]|uniref:Uma2 family endonuclease n=1 Tax=Nocardia rhizosphaerae TaxID=1691571 RepID=A0ABV8L1N0_9NOCA